MSTGDKSVNIYLKKFLSQQEMQQNFQQFLQKQTDDLYQRVYPKSGVFRGGGLSSSANDTFDVTTPLEGSNSLGKDIIFDPTFANQIPFENENTSNYYVGFRFISLPSGIQRNVRTGALKYQFDEEAVGEIDFPDSIVDDGDGTMTIIVNSVTEANVDNSGRTVRVFLRATENGGTIGPQSEITYFEDLTVQFDGVNNYIETNTGLGQNATELSTDQTEYQVALLGMTVKKNTDLRTIDDVVFLGIITGSGAGTQPTVFDQSDRNLLDTGLAGLQAQVMAMLETLGTVRHDDVTQGLVEWSQTLHYRPLGEADELTIAIGNIQLADGEVAYIDLPVPFVGGAATLQKADRSSVGLKSYDKFWVFHRDGAVINVRGGLALEQGEERQLNDIVIGNIVYLSNDDKLRFEDTTNTFHLDADGGVDNGNLVIGDNLYFGALAGDNRFNYTAGLLTLLTGGVVTDSTISSGAYIAQRALSTDEVFQSLVTGDAVSRFLMDADGRMEWSDGALPSDVDLYRETAGILATTNIIKSVLGILRLDDVDIQRESATLIGILADIRSSTGIFRAGDFANNDFIRFVEGVDPYWEILTNNVQQVSIGENGDLKVRNDVITQSGSSYKKDSDDSVITAVDASLNRIADETLFRKLLNVSPNGPADKILNISSAIQQLANGKRVTLINSKGEVVDLPTSSTVNFGDGTVSAGPNFTPYVASAASRYFKYGIFLSKDNEIIVLVPDNDAATEAAAIAPTLKKGTKIAIVTCFSLSTTGGDISNLDESSITFFGATSGGGGGGFFIVEVSTPYIASSNDEVYVDSSGGALTMTLPPTPSVDDVVRFVDPSLNWSTNNVTVDRNGSNIDGQANNVTLDVDGSWIEFTYVSASIGWRTKI